MKKLFVFSTLLSAVIAQTPSQAYTQQQLKELCKAMTDNYIGIAGYNRGMWEQGINLSKTPDIRRQNIEALKYFEKNCPYAL
jgi:hypothetical protein